MICSIGKTLIFEMGTGVIILNNFNSILFELVGAIETLKNNQMKISMLWRINFNITFFKTANKDFFNFIA